MFFGNTLYLFGYFEYEDMILFFLGASFDRSCFFLVLIIAMLCRVIPQKRPFMGNDFNHPKPTLPNPPLPNLKRPS